MPRWVFNCPECNAEFTYTVIAEPQPPYDPFAVLAKPEFPEGGMRLECPSCKKPLVYQRYQLIFRAA